MQNVILISPATRSSPGLSRAQKFRRPGGTGEESRQFSRHCYYVKNFVRFDWLRVEVFQLIFEIPTCENWPLQKIP